MLFWGKNGKVTYWRRCQTLPIMICSRLWLSCSVGGLRTSDLAASLWRVQKVTIFQPVWSPFYRTCKERKDAWNVCVSSHDLAVHKEVSINPSSTTHKRTSWTPFPGHTSWCVRAMFGEFSEKAPVIWSRIESSSVCWRLAWRHRPDGKARLIVKTISVACTAVAGPPFKSPPSWQEPSINSPTHID